MNKFQKSIVSIILVLAFIMLAACNKPSEVESNKQDETTVKQTDKQIEATTNKVEEQKEIDPFGKYDSEVTLTTGRNIGSFIVFPEGQSPDKNIWYDAYLDKLGVKVVNQWVAEGEAYNSKVNIVIASNELPDVIRVKQEQMIQLAEAGKLADLTEAYDQYASPDLKAVFSKDSIAYKCASIGGKLYAIPNVKTPASQIHAIYIRNDWLKKVGLDEKFETVDEWIELMRAFTLNDPDGNGKDDTFGMCIDRSLGVAFDTFASSYGAHKNMWVKGKDGKLIHGSTAPEMRIVLSKLAELYKEGIIDQEFGVKDWNAVKGDRNAGKFGLWTGNQSTPLGIHTLVAKSPDTDWLLATVPSEQKGILAKTPVNIKPSDSEFWVVSSSVKNPEAYIKIVNLGYEYIHSPRALKEYHTFKENNKEAFHLRLSPQMDLERGNISIAESLDEALKTNDTSKIRELDMLYWDYIQEYRKGNIGTNPDNAFNWAYNKIFGPEGHNMFVKSQFDSKNYYMDMFYGVPGTAWVDNAATLLKMRDEVFTRIIVGEDNIEAFDKFVEDFNKLGGSDSTKEVNDWYAKQ